MRYYCDGSTYMNGQKGQDSSMIVLSFRKIIREYLGNYSINYAELSAIIKAFEICNLGDEVFSDSKICVNWVLRPYRRTKQNEYIKEKILYAQRLLSKKGLSLKYISRESNLAGLELENNPFYY